MSKTEARQQMKSALDGLKAFRWLAEHQFSIEIDPIDGGKAYRLTASGPTNGIAVTREGRYLQSVVMAVKQDVEAQLIKSGAIRRPTIDDHFASIGGDA